MQEIQAAESSVWVAKLNIKVHNKPSIVKCQWLMSVAHIRAACPAYRPESSDVEGRGGGCLQELL